MENGKNFSLNLYQARLIRGKRQKDIANILGITVETYRKLEKNPEQLTLKQARIILEYLDIPFTILNFFDFLQHLKRTKPNEEIEKIHLKRIKNNSDRNHQTMKTLP